MDCIGFPVLLSTIQNQCVRYIGVYSNKGLRWRVGISQGRKRDSLTPGCDHMYSARDVVSYFYLPSLCLSSSFFFSSFSYFAIFVFLFIFILLSFLSSLVLFLTLSFSSSFPCTLFLVPPFFLSHFLILRRDAPHSPKAGQTYPVVGILSHQSVLPARSRLSPFSLTLSFLHRLGSTVWPPPCCYVTGSQQSASRPGQLLAVIRQLGSVTLR